MAERNYTARTVTASCIWCGEAFTYAHKTGRQPQLCSKECRAAQRKSIEQGRLPHLPRCKIDGCEGAAVRVGAGMCEKHYCRGRRGAPMEDPKRSYTYRTSHGYVVRQDAPHPLSHRGGLVYEHRLVAYEKHRGECPRCHWCGDALEWANAVIDHMDEDKANNQPDNLVVSCSPCNMARGSVLAFLHRLRIDGIDEFVKLARAYHAKHHDTKTAQEAAERARGG